MHETSLGGTLRDYLSGEEIDETTFEEFRQLLVKLLVEEKGYPKDRFKAKVPIKYCVDGEDYERPIDFVLYDGQGKPVFIIIFCAGNVATFERETVCAGRLIEGGPVPFALVTDTMEASLMDVRTGERIAHGMDAVPDFDRLMKMADDAEIKPLTEEQREKQTRVFHAYCGFVCGDHCECSLPPMPGKK
ncbi:MULTISPECIES: type I restriction enzyme HsdR N-terminal domain-containing protein [unclassified Pseudodesulfovibrio]|uniref:type I restriction enzyme HsdR N-terminal domain-containing protein n=1 Tax=unclassified Pseudodesulfovibrio TaxID=2661612 RepID=UPI000FEBD14B|nr:MULTISPECIES: type I restriction enzyme HsdR N-terminal domain-containing protein [unclassified Pseudodesulfovibrio]MCJ2164207.1 type I restriction enzyme HsdR N-terminal domain-containing protein [Pseudodesulfovibrio sp. S3-i]RWU05169.1 type I restriction endonuclease subunit R [Pseudodesulfovibrio sp. S3]